jgi:hypothetical protein
MVQQPRQLHRLTSVTARITRRPVTETETCLGRCGENHRSLFWPVPDSTKVFVADETLSGSIY